MKRQGLSDEYKRMIGAASQEGPDWQEIDLRKIALAHACEKFKDGYDPKAVIKAAEQFYEFLSSASKLQELDAKLPDTVQDGPANLWNKLTDTHITAESPGGRAYWGDGVMNELDRDVIARHRATCQNVLYYVERLKERGITVTSA